MRVQVKVSPTTIVEAEGQTLQEVFEQLSRMEEVFEIETCGVCGGKALRHVHRKNQDYDFFELWCKNLECRARFSFGQPKNVKGGLFPQKKTKEGDWKPDGGWEVYKQQPQTAPNGGRYKTPPPTDNVDEPIPY